MADATHCACGAALRRRPPTAGQPLRTCDACKKRRASERKQIEQADPKIKARNRDYQLRRNFGISLEDYKKMLKWQKGKCYLCGKSANEKRALAVDHNHSTGAVRGLLCTYCNRIRLGRGREDADMHRKIADYLDNNADRVKGLLHE